MRVVRRRRRQRRFQGRIAERLERHQLAKPHAPPVLRVAFQMRMPFDGHRREPQPHRARRHRLAELQRVRPQRERITVFDLREALQRLPLCLVRLAWMPLRRAGENLHVRRAKARPQRLQPAERNRARPRQHQPLRVLRRHRLRRAVPAVVPRAPLRIFLVVDFPRHLIARTRHHLRLRRDVRHALRQNQRATEPAAILRIRRLRGVRETQRACADARRQSPDRILLAPHFRARHHCTLDALRRLPIRLARKITRIRRARFQNAELPAAAHEHRPDRDDILQPNPQMPHARHRRFAKRHATPIRPALPRPHRPRLLAFHRLDDALTAAAPFRKRRRIEVFVFERSLRVSIGARRHRGPGKQKSGDNGNDCTGDGTHARRIDETPARRLSCFRCGN